MKRIFSSKKHDQLYIKGFTLVELLATIAILGIISGIIVYVSINVINSAKNKSYDVTISNIENVAMEYAIENQNNILWKYAGIDGSEQYYCVNVQDLIDTGYFKSDVLDSYIGKDLLVKSDDYVYLEMNSLTKTITKNKLLLSDDGEYISLCNDANTINSYYFDLNWILDGSNFNSSQVLAGVKIGGIDKGYVSSYFSYLPNETSWEIYGIKLNGTSISYSANGIVMTENINHDIRINTLSVSANSSSYGSVSSSSLYVLENETYTTSDNILILGDGRRITATASNIIGYTTTFSNWSSNSGTISNATNIIANFDRTIDTYTVSYDANGGSGVPDSQTKNYKETLTLSNTIPIKEGYTFLGWSTSKTATSATYGAGGSYTANVSTTLYAVWSANSYAISYTLNGGTSGTYAPTSGTYGSVVTISNPTKTVTVIGNANGTGATVGSNTSKAQTFAGWTASNLNTSTAYYGTSSSLVTTSWSNSATKVTAQYFKNLASSGNTVTLTANWTAVSFNLPTVTKTGYTCTWNTASNGSGTSYASGASYTPSTTASSSVTLYAVCTSGSYNISYTLNGGTSGTYAPTSGTYGSVVTISNPTKTVTVIGNANGTGATVGSNTSKAQTFAGWTSATVGSNAKTGTSASPSTAWSGSSTKNIYFRNLRESGTVTMVANWTAVSFNLPTVTKTGYTCTWNTASNGSGTSYASGASYTPSTTASSSVTLYAVCTSGSYNISYTLNGGTSGTYAPTSVTYGSVVTISNPTKTVTVTGNANNTGVSFINQTGTAQTFAGWTSTTVGSNAKTGISANPSTAWSGSSTKNTYFRNLRESGTVTMVANWTAVGVKLPTFTNPIGKICYWYSAPSGGTKYGASGATYSPSAIVGSSITAYLQCSNNIYIINYSMNSGTNYSGAPISYLYGTGATISGTPTRSGYTFNGWYYESTTKFSQTIGTTTTGDKTMEAKWCQNCASVTNGSCTLNASTAGACTYTTSCNTGYTISNNGKYNPTCTANTYTIGYKLNGGTSGTYAPTSGTYGSVVTISNPTKTVTVTGNANGTGATVGSNTSKAQTFSGWTSTTVGSNAKTGTSATPSTVWSGSSTKNTYFRNLRESGTVTMVANWTAVSFNLPTVTKAGYTCTWNTASNGSGTSYASGASYTPSTTASSSVTLYAVCTANTYTVSYDANGGSGAPSSQRKIYGVTLTLSSTVPTREGYTFLGWSTSRTATSATYKAGENYTVNANLTLYAVWKFTATVPLFSYTGNYEIVDDDNNVISSPSTWSGNWKIKFLTSGTLTISTLNGAKNGIDIFIVGGGGYGGSGSRYIASNSRGGGGGGGGAAVKVSGFKATTTSYSITIGSGAPDLTTNATASSFGSYSAAAAGSRPVTPSWDGNGGMKVPVGCGGLSTATVSNLTPTCTVVETVDCTSCSDGSNKVESRSGGQGNGWLYNNAGPQFTSTGTYNHQYMGNYEFFESGNLLYGAGGGSGGSGASINMYEDGNTGRTGGNATGAGAGGLGCYNDGSVHTGTAGSAAIANTGSGGGGGGGNCGSGSTNCSSTSATAGGAGGSGIVIIRNAR